MKIAIDLPDNISSACQTLFGEPPSIDNLHDEVLWNSDIEATLFHTPESVKRFFEERLNKHDVQCQMNDMAHIEISMPAVDAVSCYKELNWMALTEGEIGFKIREALEETQSKQDIKIPKSLFEGDSTLSVLQHFMNEQMEIPATLEDDGATLAVSSGELNGLLHAYKQMYTHKDAERAGVPARPTLQILPSRDTKPFSEVKEARGDTIVPFPARQRN